MQTGTIFDIKRFAIHDGPGIRTTVFFKGCPLRCPWCHNPEGQKPEPETIIRAVSPEDSASPPVQEIIGRVVDVKEVMEEVQKDILFFDESGGGVTFSGGEPLVQPEFLGSLLDACEEKNLHTCLDTSGHAPTEVFASFLDRVDLFLYDLKIMHDAQHERYTGVSNRSVLDNLRTLDELEKRVVIRFLVVPGVTDTEENIDAVADFVASLKNLREVSLLAYHRMASEKYRRLGRENELEGFRPPTEELMKSVRQRFQSRGMRVVIGA